MSERVRRIDSDAFCRRCAYNLRGTEVGDTDVAVCPECGDSCTAYFLLDQPIRRGVTARTRMRSARVSHRCALIRAAARRPRTGC